MNKECDFSYNNVTNVNELIEPQTTKIITVLVADDHTAVRDGFCRLINDEKDMQVVGKSSTGEQTVSLAKQLKPDVAVIDVSMPGLNGIDAAKQIKFECPGTAILMVSAYDNESFVTAALQSGAAGYLLKSDPFSEVINVIRMVHCGKVVVNFQVAGQVLHMLEKNRQRDVNSEQLSNRELELLRLVAKGISNKQISEKLSISEHTVETHLINIFRRLGVTSRTKAVLTAIKKGWLTLDDVP
jgi:NarL family two-component system response regulator LiaR